MFKIANFLSIALVCTAVGYAGCKKSSSDDDDNGGDATETECSDGIDNDGDGLIDCDDPDCANVLPCSCGNNIIDNAEEACDGTALAGRSCVQEGFQGGNLGCLADCSAFDTSNCTGYCGDGQKNGLEQCDGADLAGISCKSFGYEGGALGCTNGCNYDTSTCTGTPGNFCGNGIIDHALENCDGRTYINCAQFPAGADDQGQPTYLNLGFGEVGCTESCLYDFSTCSDATGDPVDMCAVLGWYGDDYCDPCEQMGGTVDPDCDTYCPVADGYCDNLFDRFTGLYSCEAAGYTDPDCGTCGNGILDDDQELCDGAQSNVTCESLGMAGGTPSCSDSCVPDTAGCYVAYTCGNGVREPREWCDGTQLPPEYSCETLGFVGGTLGCTDSCTFDVSACIPAVCGDGATNGFEACDPGNGDDVDADFGGRSCASFGFAGGVLSCSSNCGQILTDGCTVLPECGNGIVEIGEACDLANLNGLSCETFGFAGGDLGCLPNCYGFDFVACDAPATCDGSELDDGEVCDGDNLGGATCESRGFAAGTLKCNLTCTGFDTTECTGLGAGCGNGVAEFNERCDGDSYWGNTGPACADYELGEGFVRCTNSCALDFSFCGIDYCAERDWYSDGICDVCPNPDPDCDACSAADGVCSSYFDINRGGDTCTVVTGSKDPDCTLCGNGVRNPGEQCDGSQLGTVSLEGGASRSVNCIDLGYTGGTLGCNSDTCTYDSSACTMPVCGDEEAQFLEQCDTADFKGETCETLGFGKGVLGCTERCGFDINDCVRAVCGDDVAESPEACDGTDFFGRSCAGFVSGARFVGGSIVLDYYAGGTLACDNSCSDIDLAACTLVPSCGNGIVERGEACDPGSDAHGETLFGATCETLGFGGGDLGCTSECIYDVSECVYAFAATCGNGTLDPGEACDGEEHGEATCADFGLTGGALACKDDCSGFDLSGCSGGTDFCGDGKVTGYELCDGDEFAEGYGPDCESLGGGEGFARCGADCMPDRSTCGMPGDLCAILGYYNDDYCDPCELWGGDKDPDCDHLCGQKIITDEGSADDGICPIFAIDFPGVDPCVHATGIADADCGTCGNGEVEDFEDCDLANIDGKTCADFGFTGGDLNCADNCFFDFSACIY